MPSKPRITPPEVSGSHVGGRTTDITDILRPRYEAQPEDVFAEMAGLMGPGTRWWTNTDLSRWSPITQHNFDAIIVGAGNGIIVTVIAFEGGG